MRPENSGTHSLVDNFKSIAAQWRFLPITSVCPPYRSSGLERTSIALADSYNVDTYLADSTDPGRIPVLLRALGDGLSAAETMARLGLNLRSFEQQWRSYALAP